MRHLPGVQISDESARKKDDSMAPGIILLILAFGAFALHIYLAAIDHRD